MSYGARRHNLNPRRMSPPVDDRNGAEPYAVYEPASDEYYLVSEEDSMLPLSEPFDSSDMAELWAAETSRGSVDERAAALAAGLLAVEVNNRQRYAAEQLTEPETEDFRPGALDWINWVN